MDFPIPCVYKIVFGLKKQKQLYIRSYLLNIMNSGVYGEFYGQPIKICEEEEKSCVLA